MRWKRRRCRSNIVSLLSLLSLLGVLVILSHQDWLTGSQWWRERPTDSSVGGLLRSGTKGNHSSKLTLWRGLPEPPPSPKAAAGSPREHAPSPRGVTGQANSPAANASLSKEVGLGDLLTSEPYPYIINEPDMCPEEAPAPFLVLLIATEVRQSEARDAIRQTWGNRSVAPGLGLVRLFLLGVREGEPDDRQQSSLAAESRQHRDIIQQDYLDTYNNLTVKTLMGMRWVATHCPHASYVMKTDSDMFVNTEYLVHKLLRPEMAPRRDYFTGYLMRGYKPNRNKRSKWYMSPELYPGEMYPTFCSGTGYVLSGDLAGNIYRASLGIGLLHLEDVYIGLCLAKLGVEPSPPPNEFLFNHWRVSYTSCRYSQLITSHQFRPNELLRYWRHLQSNKHAACVNSSKRTSQAGFARVDRRE